MDLARDFCRFWLSEPTVDLTMTSICFSMLPIFICHDPLTHSRTQPNVVLHPARSIPINNYGNPLYPPDSTDQPCRCWSRKTIQGVKRIGAVIAAEFASLGSAAYWMAETDLGETMIRRSVWFKIFQRWLTVAFRPVLIFSVVVFFSGVRLNGQTVAGIHGTVMDPTGAVIAGAHVTATNTATGVASSAATSSPSSPSTVSERHH